MVLRVKRIHGDNKLVVSRTFFDEFECGFMPSHPSNPCMIFRFMVIGVFFVVFDLEVSLLLGVPYQEVMYFNFY